MTDEKLKNAVQIKQLLIGIGCVKDIIEKNQISSEEVSKDQSNQIEITLYVHNNKRHQVVVPAIDTEAGKIFMDGLNKIIHDLQFAFDMI